jgi:hypothetical protein
VSGPAITSTPASAAQADFGLQALAADVDVAIGQPAAGLGRQPAEPLHRVGHAGLAARSGAGAPRRPRARCAAPHPRWCRGAGHWLAVAAARLAIIAGTAAPTVDWPSALRAGQSAARSACQPPRSNRVSAKPPIRHCRTRSSDPMAKAALFGLVIVTRRSIAHPVHPEAQRRSQQPRGAGQGLRFGIGIAVLRRAGRRRALREIVHPVAHIGEAQGQINGRPADLAVKASRGRNRCRNSRCPSQRAGCRSARFPGGDSPASAGYHRP